MGQAQQPQSPDLKGMLSGGSTQQPSGMKGGTQSAGQAPAQAPMSPLLMSLIGGTSMQPGGSSVMPNATTGMANGGQQGFQGIAQGFQGGIGGLTMQDSSANNGTSSMMGSTL